MKALGTLRAVLYFGALGYLGFYVYGLLMGAFSPGQIVGFSILAVVFAAVAVIHAIRVRRALRDPELRGEIMRDVHHLRERRGF